MNLIKKGIGTLLIAGLMVSSCSDDDNIASPGMTSIVLSSFEVTPSGDGTVVTVTPLSVGVDSYVVDFGHNGSTATISEQNGSATYDYPNEVEEVSYTITVTAKATGQSDVTKSENVTVIHTPPTVSTTPTSPDGNDSDVFAIFSNGMDFDGSLLSWENRIDVADVIANIIPIDGNDIIQISRLGAEAGVVELDEEVVVAHAFASPANDNPDGIGATDIHFDVHSVFAEGINKLKITLINGDNDDEYVLDGIDLVDSEWANLSYDLATDFSAPVVRIDEIKFEVGAGGTANDHATISVDNIILTKDPSATILNGGFDLSTAQWRFATFTDGTTTPFGSSSDGSWTNYDGTDNGSKTRGAKWTSSQSGGPQQGSSSRNAYQAVTLTPNTDYILEYEYAIKDDTADDPIGGRRIVGIVLDGHYIDGADAIADIDSNLGNHVGTIAQGKFSDTVGTLVQIPFTSNDSGEVSVLFYAVTPKDAWIDNVKVYAN
ncbi:hypothetical protein [Winogradskyella schleiferi]|uniref:hypothetical protein n=1 Tax=Winogradskyella schleiferi TaxID=2686078 RepID=UPI0015BE356B|nr:hypothetical protein [Winogradskyella schleiferi]